MVRAEDVIVVITDIHLKNLLANEKRCRCHSNPEKDSCAVKECKFGNRSNRSPVLPLVFDVGFEARCLACCVLMSLSL